MTAIFKTMKVFRSKVDAYYLTLLVVLVLLIDGGGTVAVTQALYPLFLPHLLLAFAVLALPGLLLLFLLPVRYRILRGELRVDSGRRCWRVPLEAIRRITPVRSVNPGPALSLRRLRVEYSEGDRLKKLDLSPRDTSAFLNALTAADPELVLKEGCIVRYTAGKVILLANYSR